MSDGGAWCLPDGHPGSPYLEVDFGEEVLVCAVETRGFDNNGDLLYAHEFQLSFSHDGSSFAKYTEDSVQARVRTRHAQLASLLQSRITI